MSSRLTPAIARGLMTRPVTRKDDMAGAPAEDRIAALLDEVGEIHHRVYRITDGTDDDWASWYADWLLDLSELPEVLGTRPVRSHLVHALVQCDLDYTAAETDEAWPHFYARALVSRFSP
jgi:hypothetical protein